MVRWVAMGDKHTHLENKQANERKLAADKEAHLDKCADIWAESQGAFNNQPSNVHPGKRTPDDVRFKTVHPEVGADEQRAKFSVTTPKGA